MGDPDELYGRVSTLKHMTLAFAEKDNDLDLAIRIMSQDLSHAYNYLQIAELREKENPEDTIEIYRRQVEPLINRTNNGSYQEAVEFLEKVHTLLSTHLPDWQKLKIELECSLLSG